MEKRRFRCKECGALSYTTNELEGLNFKNWGDINGQTSECSCSHCGVKTIQRVWRSDFTGGEFLIIKPHNRIRKG